VFYVFLPSPGTQKVSVRVLDKNSVSFTTNGTSNPTLQGGSGYATITLATTIVNKQGVLVSGPVSGQTIFVSSSGPALLDATQVITNNSGVGRVDYVCLSPGAGNIVFTAGAHISMQPYSCIAPPPPSTTTTTVPPSTTTTTVPPSTITTTTVPPSTTTTSSVGSG